MLPQVVLSKTCIKPLRTKRAAVRLGIDEALRKPGDWWLLLLEASGEKFKEETSCYKHQLCEDKIHANNTKLRQLRKCITTPMPHRQILTTMLQANPKMVAPSQCTGQPVQTKKAGLSNKWWFLLNGNALFITRSVDDSSHNMNPNLRSYDQKNTPYVDGIATYA